MYSVKQIAYIIKVHPLTVRRYIREKKLNAVKMGGCVRIREDHLEAFQTVYEAKESPQDQIKQTPVTFTDLDPLWQLEGLGMSIGSSKPKPYDTKR